jgi:hypothetical protein
MSLGPTTLTQNYPTTNFLKVTQVSNPEEYTLYLFLYSDWQVGKQATSFSKGQTQLNSDAAFLLVGAGLCWALLRAGA